MAPSHVLPLYKIYQNYPLAAKGKVPDLDDVIPLVRRYHPRAYMEGSAGLARMFIKPADPKADPTDPNSKPLFVAYTWATARRRDLSISWKYLIFEEGQPF